MCEYQTKLSGLKTVSWIPNIQQPYSHEASDQIWLVWYMDSTRIVKPLTNTIFLGNYYQHFFHLLPWIFTFSCKHKWSFLSLNFSSVKMNLFKSTLSIKFNKKWKREEKKFFFFSWALVHCNDRTLNQFKYWVKI